MQPFHPAYPRLHDSTTTLDSPAYEKESHFGSEMAARRVMAESNNVVKEYEENRDG
jgi:mitofusin